MVIKIKDAYLLQTMRKTSQPHFLESTVKLINPALLHLAILLS